MRTLKSLLTLAAATLALAGITATQSAKADVPNLQGYQFTCDVKSDVLDPLKYGILGNNSIYFTKSHSPFFTITTQNPDGSFVGKMWFSANGTKYNITGAMTQNIGESLAGTFEINFKMDTGGNSYNMYARLEFSGAVFVAGGYSYRPIDGNYRNIPQGPAPITGVGYAPQGVVK